MSIKYFPFTGTDYKPALGLKPLDLNEWIEIDGEWENQLKQKREIMLKHRETVLKVLPTAEDGCLELRAVLADHLAKTFPKKYALVHSLLMLRGEQFPIPNGGAQAMAQIGVWTQEDWALMSPEAPVRLEAGSVYFPSRWSLKDKIGRTLNEIHQPVPEYDSVAKPTQSFLERITVDRPMWRLNWTIHDSDQLFCPGSHPPAQGLTKQNVIDRTWLRLERQTLRRLPRTGFVAFSIRTYVHPMREVVADSENRRLALESLERLPSETAAYKGMGAFHGLLTEALRG